MFGNPITDGIKIADNTAYAIIKFDLSTQLPKFVKFIQLVNTDAAPDDLSPATATEKSIAELMALLETSGGAECHYAINGTDVLVFVDLIKFPYTTTTEIVFWYYRNAEKVSVTIECLDIPEEARRLFNLYVELALRDRQGKAAPDRLSSAITAEKTKLGLI